MSVSKPRKNTSKTGLDPESLEPTRCPKCKGTAFYKRRGGPQGFFKNVYYINYHCNNSACGRWFCGWDLKWYKEEQKEML